MSYGRYTESANASLDARVNLGVILRAGNVLDGYAGDGVVATFYIVTQTWERRHLACFREGRIEEAGKMPALPASKKQARCLRSQDLTFAEHLLPLSDCDIPGQF